MNTFDGIEKENLTENDLKYIKSTVSGVFDKLEIIDDKINSKLIGWTVGRFSAHWFSSSATKNSHNYT